MVLPASLSYEKSLLDGIIAASRPALLQAGSPAMWLVRGMVAAMVERAERLKRREKGGGLSTPVSRNERI